MYGEVKIITNNTNQIKLLERFVDSKYTSNIYRQLYKCFGSSLECKTIFVANTKEELDEFYFAFKTKHNIIFSSDWYNVPETDMEVEQYSIFCRNMTRQRLQDAHERNIANYKTNEFREKISQVTKGENNPMYGKHHTEESKQKMSVNRKGKACGTSNGNYGNIGEYAKNGKKVYQYADKEHTKLIRTFNTMTLALEFLKLKGHSSLYKAIKSNKKYKGYYWSK